MREHIGQGKLPTKMELSRGEVSWVMGADGSLRRIDLGPGSKAAPADGEDQFDADVALATGELASVANALQAALEGSRWCGRCSE